MTSPAAAEAPGLLEALWRHRWLVVSVVLLGTVLGALSALLIATPAAAARVGLVDPSDNRFGVVSESSDAYRRYAAQQARYMASEDVLSVAASRLGTSVDDLRGQVETETAAANDLVTVRATAETGDRAAEIANGVVGAYRQVTAEQTRAQLAERLRVVAAEEQQARESLSGPERRAALDEALAALSQRRADIGEDADAIGDGVQFVDAARATSVRAALGPAVLQNGVAGFLVGAVLAAGAAYVLADRNQTVRTGSRAAEVLGVPLLGEVATLHGPERRALTELERMPAEPFQFVTAGLRTLQPRGVVLVTSPARADGRTTTAANVAVAAARDGLRVAVVDGDVRTRGLSALDEADGADVAGLVELAAGRASLSEVLRPVSLAGGHALWVLPAGRRVDDLPNLFRSNGMTEAVRALRESHDLVVVDCPPVLAHPDAGSLSPSADGVLVVCGADTSASDLAAVRDRLGLFPTTILGVALTAAEPVSVRARRPASAGVEPVADDLHRSSVAPDSTPGGGRVVEHDGQASTAHPAAR